MRAPARIVAGARLRSPEGALVVGLGLAVLASFVAAPLARALSPGFAVASATGLEDGDLAVSVFTGGERLPLAPPDAATGALSVLDAWRRPLRSVPQTIGPPLVYSTGANGQDERGSGDDVPLDRDDIALVARIRWLPVALAALAIVIAWAWSALRVLRWPRSESLAHEGVRAAWVASLPGAGAAGLGAGIAHAMRMPLTSAGKLPFTHVPVPVAIGGFVGLIAFLGALGFRHRRGVPRERSAASDEAPVPGEQPPVLALVLVTLFALTIVGGMTRERFRSARHARFLTAAEAGLPAAANELLPDADDAELRAFVERVTSDFPADQLSSASLARLGELGSAAAPVLVPLDIRALYTREGNGVATGPWDQLRHLDPRFDRFFEEAKRHPRELASVLLNESTFLAAQGGRLRAIEALAPLLDVKEGTWDGARPGSRICDETAQAIQSLVLRREHDFGLPYSIGDASKWDAAIARVKAWWQANGPAPKLAPAGWVVVSFRGLTVDGRHRTSLDLTIDSTNGQGFSGLGSDEDTLAMGPLAPGQHALAGHDKNASKTVNVPLSLGPDATEWVDIDFVTGRFTTSASPPAAK